MDGRGVQAVSGVTGRGTTPVCLGRTVREARSDAGMYSQVN